MRTSYRSPILIVVLALTLGFPALAQPGVRALPGEESPQIRVLVPRSRSPQLTADKADALAGVAQLKLGSLDRGMLAAEDSTPKADAQPYRYAIGRDVFLSPDTSGTWVKIEDGMQLWRLRITAAEATSISFAFDRFFLPPSAQLLIYSVNEKSWIRPFEAGDNNAARRLFTPLLESGDVVIELKIAEAERGQLELSLAQVYQGYRGPGTSSFGDNVPFDKSGACNVDVACPQGAAWGQQIRSVARYTFVKNGGGFLCTGAMVNNTSGDFRPFFLTANHCVSTNTVANSVITYWNYNNAGCRTPGSGASGSAGNGSLSQFLNGATLRSTWGPSDLTLLELNSAPPKAWNVYWAGWSRSSANPNSATGIHHPQGQEKRISMENDPTTTTSYLSNSIPGDGRFVRVEDWDSGTTEGGSSGSPLFDNNKRVIGHLKGGFAACGNNSSDWYGRVSADWAGGGSSASRLSNWLDPTGAGNSVINGAEQGNTPPPQAPAAPTNLTASALSTTEILLAWDDNANNETGYEIEFRPFAGNFVLAGTVAPNVESASVFGLASETTYDFRVRAINGSGNSSYTNIASAATSGDTTPCVEGPNTLCLLGDRFRVRSEWLTSSGASDSGRAVELTPDTGYFWFFNPDNVEVVAKVRNACINPFNRFWFFAGGLTNVEVNITVTDTQTGTVKVYRNPLGTPFQPITDTQAFATCP